MRIKNEEKFNITCLLPLCLYVNSIYFFHHKTKKTFIYKPKKMNLINGQSNNVRILYSNSFKKRYAAFRKKLTWRIFHNLDYVIFTSAYFVQHYSVLWENIKEIASKHLHCILHHSNTASLHCACVLWRKTFLT